MNNISTYYILISNRIKEYKKWTWKLIFLYKIPIFFCQKNVLVLKNFAYFAQENVYLLVRDIQISIYKRRKQSIVNQLITITKKEILSLKKIHRNNLNKLFERKSVNKFQASSQLNHFTKSISPEKNLKKHYFLSR